MCPCDPEVERVMHEQIREKWADYTTLRGTTRTLHPRSILEFHRRRQPSFDVEQRPFALHVLPDSPQQELVINIVEQTFDIELQNPVVSPAALTRYTDGIERRFPGSIT